MIGSIFGALSNHSLKSDPFDSLCSLPETSSGQAGQAGPLSSAVRSLNILNRT
jgi:hypothetical protein